MADEKFDDDDDATDPQPPFAIYAPKRASAEEIAEARKYLHLAYRGGARGPAFRHMTILLADCDSWREVL